MNVTAVLEFLMNALLVVLAVVGGVGLLLILKMTFIYEWYLQNKKAREQEDEGDTE